MKNIFIVFAVLLITSCNKTHSSTAITQSNIQGKWSGGYGTGYVADNFSFNFNNDSFTLKEIPFTDGIDVNCFNDSNQANYIKGTFAIANSVLQLNGLYCDSLFNNAKSISFCPMYPIGNFSHNFKMQLKNGKLIMLDFKNMDGTNCSLTKQ